MFCCRDKRQKVKNNINSKQHQAAIRLQTFGSLEINDEAAVNKEVVQAQKINTLTSSRVQNDLYTQCSRSNSKGPKSSDKLTQNIPVFMFKKTPFTDFNTKGTHINTKYISTKQGFTLLVTKLIE